MRYQIKWTDGEWGTNDRKLAYAMFDSLVDRYPGAIMVIGEVRDA